MCSLARIYKESHTPPYFGTYSSLTTLYSTQNDCVLGLCPLSGILDVSETGSPSIFRFAEGDTYTLLSHRNIA
jgi:hypothetical protein